MRGNIHLVTAIYRFRRKSEKRCFGWFHTLEEAIEAVESNRGSMQESLYEWIVIETMDAGIHPIALNEVWYRFNFAKTQEDRRWVKCRKPRFSIGVINWGIG
jgi:hypothetical protein